MSAVLVAVAGQAGSGKSRLAGLIADRLGARRIDVGDDVAPYPDSTGYANALSTATQALASGSLSRIVLCGAFHTCDARRKLLRLASASRSALLYVECSANEFVRRRRLRIRLTTGPDALTAPEAELWVNRLVADDSLYELMGFEIPRAAQMLIDTTVGVDIWGGLAASRVELWAAETTLPTVTPIQNQASVSVG